MRICVERCHHDDGEGMEKVVSLSFLLCSGSGTRHKLWMETVLCWCSWGHGLVWTRSTTKSNPSLWNRHLMLMELLNCSLPDRKAGRDNMFYCIRCEQAIIIINTKLISLDLLFTRCQVATGHFAQKFCNYIAASKSQVCFQVMRMRAGYNQCSQECQVQVDDCGHWHWCTETESSAQLFCG
jgi:hypothetical protein